MVFPGTAGLDAKVLVLNRLYMAVRVIPARRAFRLLCKDRAEVINVEDGRYINYDFDTWMELGEIQRQLDPDAYDFVRTVRCHVAVPRIIRLFGFDRVPQQRVKLNRRNVIARDSHSCQYCGKTLPMSELSIDHVVPRSQGGGDTWENLVAACHRCNAKKGGRTPAQANMRLMRTPKQPRRHPMITMRVARKQYESWRVFLENSNWTVEYR